MPHRYRLEIVSLIIVLVALVAVSLTSAQGTALDVECGDIIDAEFTQNEQAQIYRIAIQPGSVLEVSASTLGGSLEFAIAIVDPAQNIIYVTDASSASPSITTELLGASGRYTIGLWNGYQLNGNYIGANNRTGTITTNGFGIGVYTLSIGCTLPDQTIIRPGERPSEPAFTPTPSIPTFGFPGLPPVDFSTAFRLPLTLGTAQPGEIPAIGNAVLGFYFSGEAGQTLDLTFTRASGNLSLGIAVLSADNQVAYASALVGAQRMSAQILLPVGGEYTIGVFRIDIGAPAAPEATRFEITASVG